MINNNTTPATQLLAPRAALGAPLGFGRATTAAPAAARSAARLLTATGLMNTEELELLQD